MVEWIQFFLLITRMSGDAGTNPWVNTMALSDRQRNMPCRAFRTALRLRLSIKLNNTWTNDTRDKGCYSYACRDERACGVVARRDLAWKTGFNTSFADCIKPVTSPCTVGDAIRKDRTITVNTQFIAAKFAKTKATVYGAFLHSQSSFTSSIARSVARGCSS